MIFIDSNIPMYLIGKEHPNKSRALSLLNRLILDEERLVTDAETLQEILHRYKSIHRTDAIQPAFDTLLGLVDEVFPVELTDMIKAKDLLTSFPGVSARDTVHAAVMERNNVTRIISFDKDFDRFPFLERIS